MITAWYNALQEKGNLHLMLRLTSSASSIWHLVIYFCLSCTLFPHCVSLRFLPMPFLRISGHQILRFNTCNSMGRLIASHCSWSTRWESAWIQRISLGITASSLHPFHTTCSVRLTINPLMLFPPSPTCRSPHRLRDKVMPPYLMPTPMAADLKIGDGRLPISFSLKMRGISMKI